MSGLTTTFDSLSMFQPTTAIVPTKAAGPVAQSTLAAPQQWFLNFSTGNQHHEHGPAVNEFTALTYLAIFKCVSLIAGKIAGIPLVTYRSNGRTRLPATDRSEYNLLLHEFNPDMSAMTAREAGIAHLLTWGNSYTQIVWNKSGTKPLALVPFGPDQVLPKRDTNGDLIYEIMKRGSNQKIGTLDAAEMLHVPGLSFDGLVGYSPIRVAKTTIRAGMGQDLQAERFVSRGIRPPGAITLKDKFPDDQAAIEYRDRFRRIHSHENGDLQVLILEDGAEWKSLGVDPASAQLLESRQYSGKEICGLYHVPPHLTGDMESTSAWGTGIAEMTQGFVDNCLLVWMQRVEAEYKRKLARDDPNVYYRHRIEEILRGDITKRTAALAMWHQRGIITDNEWRDIEHLNPVEGGDVRHFQLAEGRIDETGEVLTLPPPAGTTPAGPPKPAADATPTDPHTSAASAAAAGDVQSTALNGAQITALLLLTDKVAAGDYTAAAGEAVLKASFPLMDKALIASMIEQLAGTAADKQDDPDPPPAPIPPVPPGSPAPEPADPAKAGRVAGKLRAILVTQAGRCLRKEAAEAVKAAARPERFVTWVEEFYAKHAAMVADHVGAVVEAWAEMFGGPTDYPARHMARSRAELLDAADGPPGEFEARVSRVAERWQSDRLAEVAAEFQPVGV